MRNAVDKTAHIDKDTQLQPFQRRVVAGEGDSGSYKATLPAPGESRGLHTSIAASGGDVTVVIPGVDEFTLSDGNEVLLYSDGLRWWVIKEESSPSTSSSSKKSKKEKKKEKKSDKGSTSS